MNSDDETPPLSPSDDTPSDDPESSLSPSEGDDAPYTISYLKADKGLSQLPHPEGDAPYPLPYGEGISESSPLSHMNSSLGSSNNESPLSSPLARALSLNEGDKTSPLSPLTPLQNNPDPHLPPDGSSVSQPSPESNTVSQPSPEGNIVAPLSSPEGSAAPPSPSELPPPRGDPVPPLPSPEDNTPSLPPQLSSPQSDPIPPLPSPEGGINEPSSPQLPSPEGGSTPPSSQAPQGDPIPPLPSLDEGNTTPLSHPLSSLSSPLTQNNPNAVDNSDTLQKEEDEVQALINRGLKKNCLFSYLEHIYEYCLFRLMMTNELIVAVALWVL